MVKLVPGSVVAQVRCILLFQQFAIHLEVVAQAFTTYRRGSDAMLLKKPQTLWSCVFPLLLTPSLWRLFCWCLHSTTCVVSPLKNKPCLVSGSLLPRWHRCTPESLISDPRTHKGVDSSLLSLSYSLHQSFQPNQHQNTQGYLQVRTVLG